MILKVVNACFYLRNPKMILKDSLRVDVSFIETTHLGFSRNHMRHELWVFAYVIVDDI